MSCFSIEIKVTNNLGTDLSRMESLVGRAANIIHPLIRDCCIHWLLPENKAEGNYKNMMGS